MKSDLLALDRQSKGWTGVVGHLSHFLITKLATLRMKQKSLQDVIPELLKGYYLAVENNLIEGGLTQDDLQSLGDTANLEEQIAPMIDLLESFNSYCIQLRSDAPTIQVLSVRSCVNKLLETYPFISEAQRQLVQFDQGSDFGLRCAPIFMSALLHNLLSNGLMSIEKAGHGEIHIWVSEDEGIYTLNIKDTGLGMNERACARVFGHALSMRNDKFVPGLGLCRLAIQHAGGDIVCSSVNGEYTHFQIMINV